MMQSMTGFASKTILLTAKDGSFTHLTMSIKSLNARFLETTCKIPYALNHLETEFIKLFKQKLGRGHVVFTIHLSNPNFFKGSVQPDISFVKSYLNALNTIKQECNLSGTITISDMLNLSTIFSIEDQPIDEKTKSSIMQMLDEIIVLIIKTRSMEGESLQRDLEARCKIMNTEIKQVEKAAELFMAKRKKEIISRLSTIDQDNARVAENQQSALYFELDKIDIHEEIVRFNNHLKTFIDFLNAAEQEKGRRLDFILQELARETNTIAAKCSDSTISSLAINIKVELEKAREQVQNIV